MLDGDFVRLDETSCLVKYHRPDLGSSTVAVNLDETGVSFDELTRTIPDGAKGTPALTTDVYDPSGQVISVSASISDDPFGVVHISILGFRVGRSGNHILRISYAGHGSFERVLRIP